MLTFDPCHVLTAHVSHAALKPDRHKTADGKMTHTHTHTLIVNVLIIGSAPAVKEKLQILWILLH